MTHADVLVVGASVSAGALVSQLRAEGFPGRVMLVDSDPDAPYDRPPLSKEFLTSSDVRPGALWWHEDCELVPGVAVSLEPVSRCVQVQDAEGRTQWISAGHLVVATGAVPVRLPGQPDAVCELRTAGDARRLRNRATAGQRVVILGAGTIGTELASSLVDRGCDVSLVDLADCPLDRFLAGHLSLEVRRWIEEAGVSLHLGTRVHGVREDGNRLAVLTDSGSIAGDLVVSAVGVRPNTDWLVDAGLDVGDGLRCDVRGVVLDVDGQPMPGLYACGDVASWPSPDGVVRRREDWTSAQRQGRRVARHILGGAPASETELDYFWSHQFGRRIQVLGIPDRSASLVHHVNEPQRGRLFCTLEKDAGTVAWIAVNSPKEFALAMRKSTPVAL